MSTALQPLPEPPHGFRYYAKRKDVLQCPDLLAYQHLVLKAWDDLDLSGVLTLNGVPTVYISDSAKPLPPGEAAKRQLSFWNQGLATVLLLRDPQNVRVFSSMHPPLDPDTADEESVESSLVESLGFATQAAWAEFYIQLGTGHYYNRPEHREKFDPSATVDAYLLDNLAQVRNELASGPDGLSSPMAHSFLGRILFTCYLCHRGIIKLENYLKGTKASDILQLIRSVKSEDASALFYGKLFPKLRSEFNSSMFDDELEAEAAAIKPRHIDAIRHFLEGSEMTSGQRKLGFAAYNFACIPVETISSIYERFLEHEDETGKRELGAYYTPRLLAEMTLDIALKGRRPLAKLRFLDPSCGSGIFLVLTFNRLAAEWRRQAKKNLTVPEQAEALLERLGRLRGVDKNLTACRISCFSLYLAFLDQFEPADVRRYVAETGQKLPNLLDSPGIRKPRIPVVWHRDFTELENSWQEPFDIVIGNPPWGERGSKQLALPFMEAAPKFLKPDGTGTLILPTKVFFNKTDAFQKQWLQRVTLETVVQLADFRHILFKGAKCPATVVRFNPHAPDGDHSVEYITPKVTRTDLRDGVITVSAQEHKWIPLQTLLAAADQQAIGMAWKTQLWGTPRDQKLLNYLFTLPRLGEMVGYLERELESGEKVFIEGHGFQPFTNSSTEESSPTLKWPLTDPFVSPEVIKGTAYVPMELCTPLGAHLANSGYRTDKVHRIREEIIYRAPLVLMNKGFSSASYVDYGVRFRDSLRAFKGLWTNNRLLMFLAAFLDSSLAKYFGFHTAANIGTERRQLHLDEALRFPFFPPEDAPDPVGAKKALKTVSSRFQAYMAATKKSAEKLAKQLEKAEDLLAQLRGHDGDKSVDDLRKDWRSKQKAATETLRRELEPLIYAYFGLTEQDIALVEDTCDIFDRSDTPTSLASAATIPTLQPLASADELKQYADRLCLTLNQRITGNIRVVASGRVHHQTGLALVELAQSKVEAVFRPLPCSDQLLEAADKLQQACVERWGSTIEFHRAGWYFEGKKIFIIKPARRGEWTRTAALNDAAELHQHILTARRAAKA
jgi:hypothetical protein